MTQSRESLFSSSQKDTALAMRVNDENVERNHHLPLLAKLPRKNYGKAKTSRYFKIEIGS
jgi:hypothetical protein